jgi:hypothetical protein
MVSLLAQFGWYLACGKCNNHETINLSVEPLLYETFLICKDNSEDKSKPLWELSGCKSSIT